MNLTKRKYRYILSSKDHVSKFGDRKVEIIEAHNLKEGRQILQEKYPECKVSKGYVAEL